MPELVTFAVIVLCVGVCLRFAYLMGRDAAESEAFETIATLRDELRRRHLREQLRRHRTGRFDGQTEVDLWMQ